MAIPNTQKDLRNYVTTLLLNATAAGANVYNNKITNVLIVFVNEGSSDFSDRDAAFSLENYTLEIAIAVKQNSLFADTLDDLLHEVKTLLFEDTGLRVIARLSSYSVTKEFVEDADKKLAIANFDLIFEVETPIIGV